MQFQEESQIKVALKPIRSGIFFPGQIQGADSAPLGYQPRSPLRAYPRKIYKWAQDPKDEVSSFKKEKMAGV